MRESERGKGGGKRKGEREKEREKKGGYKNGPGDTTRFTQGLVFL